MANRKDSSLEVRDGVNLDKIKKELNEYVRKQVDFEVKEVIEKNQKNLLRNKTFVIVRRDILILLLIFLSLYLGYQLYQTGYFNKYYKRGESANNYVIPPTEEPVNGNTIEPEEVKPSLEELIKKYGNYINPYLISSKSKYFMDFYEGKMSDGLRLYLTFINLDSSNIEIDEESTFIDEKNFKDKYNSLFLEEYKGSSFDFLGNTFKYSESRGIYFASSKVSNDFKSDVVREIIDIQEGDDIVITTVEGFKKDNKVLNPLTNKEIDGTDLVKNQSKLVKVKYSFANNNSTYKLKKIEVIN